MVGKSYLRGERKLLDMAARREMAAA